MILGICWFLAAALSAILTIKLYLPKLLKRSRFYDSDAPESFPKRKYAPRILVNWRMWAMVIILATVAGLSGYNASKSDLDLTAVLRLSTAVVIFPCAAITDIETELLPNFLSVVMIISRIILAAVEFFLNQNEALTGIISSMIVLIVCFVFLLIMSVITHGGLGGGDIKLLAATGFLCDIMIAIGTYIIGLFLCALVSLILLISKKKTVKDVLPLGPFICAGYFISVILM